MKPTTVIKYGVLMAFFLPLLAWAGPTEDLAAYQAFFKQQFPELSPTDLSDGMYNFDQDKRAQWEEIMEFPPYELVLDEAETKFNRKLKSGKTLSDCLENGGKSIAHTYPRFDTSTGKVITLASEINQCYQKNGEQKKSITKGELVDVIAYLANTSRGKLIQVNIPDDARALAAYEDGKRVYFTRRGPRDFACYHCHWKAAGKRIRGNVLSSAVGQATHFPTYRSKWGGIGSIQRRYKGCMKNVGAVPLKPGSESMNNLQFFHTFLSNGIPMNAPGTRF